MKTSVSQCLVDAKDPLALALVEQGADIFQLVPVSEWKYTIYKVTYFHGDIDQPEERSRKFKEGYILSMPNWIENDADVGFNYDWCKWEVIEEDVKPLTDYRNSTYGRGLYPTIDNLKQIYRIRSKRF